MGPDPPSEGDGYTYEHLAGRPEAWLDFMADTGDGGNPTYAVARSLAAPELPVQTPAHLVASAHTDSEGSSIVTHVRSEISLHRGTQVSAGYGLPSEVAAAVCVCA